MPDPNPELDPETVRFFECVLAVLGVACFVVLCLLARILYLVWVG